MMSELEVIGKQQVEIETLKSEKAENTGIAASLRMKFYAIGQPLNDNVLQFNKAQLKWAMSVAALIDQLRTNDE